jgi:hypothetical protein
MEEIRNRNKLSFFSKVILREWGQSKRINRFPAFGSPSSQGLGWLLMSDLSPLASKLLSSLSGLSRQ